MRRAYLPREVIAAAVRSGRIAAGKSAIGGALGGAAAGLAASGLKKAAAQEASEAEIQFPSTCCNCLAMGPSIQPVESKSVVNRGVAYTFSLPIPHCPACKHTANRKRLGLMGLFAVFIASSLLIGIAVAIAGGVLERDGWMSASPVLGLLAGVAVTTLTAKARRPRPGQASAYQAVYASALDVEFSGTPTGAVLSFANDVYGSRFIAANRGIGVVAR